MSEVILANQPPVTVEDIARKTTVLAQQLSYEGDLSLGALEDGIRFYQKRTFEDLFELGKRLLLLKEQTQHGEFINRIELLGFDKSLARKLMVATLKFSKVETSPLLKSAKTQSKLLELITLDDDEINLIEQGGSIGDVSLDSIETMSVRELKKALREAKSDADAKDQIIKTKDEKLNKLDTELTKLKSPTAIKKREQSEQQQIELEGTNTLKTAALTFLTALARFQNEVSSVQDAAMEHNIFSLGERAEQTVVTTLQRVAQLSTDFSVQVDFQEMVNPMWLFDTDNSDIETPDVIYGQQDDVVEG